MKKLPIVIAVSVALGLLIVGTMVRADTVTYHAYTLTQAANLTRPPALKPASTITVTSTAGASATSSQLTQDAAYYLTCLTAAYIDTSATSTCTASSADFPLPAGVVLSILSTADVRYLCARNVTSDGSCFLVEGQ